MKALIIKDLKKANKENFFEEFLQLLKILLSFI